MGQISCLKILCNPLPQPYIPQLSIVARAKKDQLQKLVLKFGIEIKCLNESMVEPILPDLLPPTASQVPQEARPHGTNDLAWNVWCQDLEAC